MNQTACRVLSIPRQRNPSASVRSHHYARKTAQVLVDLPSSPSNSTTQPPRDAIQTSPSAEVQQTFATSSSIVGPRQRELPNSVFFVSSPRTKDSKKESYRAQPLRVSTVASGRGEDDLQSDWPQRVATGDGIDTVWVEANWHSSS